MGSSRAKPGPTRMRATCGTISPTQPIWPEIATTAAVTSVAPATTITAQAPGLDAQGLGFLVAQRQHVDAPAQQEQGCQAQEHGRNGSAQVASGGAGQAAQEPESDRRQLVVGVGQDLEQGDHRAGEGADDHAGQDQHQYRLAAADGGGHQIDQGHGGEAAGEGEQLDAQNRQGEKDAQHRPHASAGRDAQDVGRNQGIAEQVLVGGPGGGEGGPDEQRRADARQPNAEQHGVGGRDGSPPAMRRQSASTISPGVNGYGPVRSAKIVSPANHSEQARDEDAVAWVVQGALPPAGPSRRSSAVSSSST